MFDIWQKLLINLLKMIWEPMRKIIQIITGQGHDYTAGSLLDYPYVIEYNKQKAIHLSKQKSFDADPIAIQQINFTVNLDCASLQCFSFLKLVGFV